MHERAGTYGQPLTALPLRIEPLQAIRVSATQEPLSQGEEIVAAKVPDLLHLIERLYALEQPLDSWMTGVAHAAFADGHALGMGAVFYDIRERAISLDHVLGIGISETLSHWGDASHRDPGNVPIIRHNYRSRLCGLQSELTQGRMPDAFVEQMASEGFNDAIMLNGLDTSGIGLALYFFGRDLTFDAEYRAAYERLSVHLSNAYRLYRRLHSQPQPAVERARAIFSDRGKLKDMREPLSNGTVEGMKKAMAERRWALGPVRKNAPREAIEAWKALVRGRWALVDHFESDGKRYILAQDNTHEIEPTPSLSAREQQVVELAALGRSNKVIAYELGIAHATVRVLMNRAMNKLEVRTREELIALVVERERTPRQVH